MFVVDSGGPVPPGIYTQPTKGGVATILISATNSSTEAAWSPDGARIAFTAGAPTGGTPSAGVEVADATKKDSGVRALDNPNAKHAYDSSPSWAPDGASVLVERNVQQGHAPQFVAVNVDTPGERQVLSFTPPESGSSPRWGGNLGSAPALLVGRGLDVIGAAKLSLAAVAVADFTDLHPQPQSGRYSATVNWGDNSAASTGIVGFTEGPSGGRGIVRADHTYQQTGTYTVTTTVHKPASRLSDPSFTSQASISWAVLEPAQAFSVPADIPVQGLLAVLSYPSTLGPVTALGPPFGRPPPLGKFPIARIDWNDVHSTDGTPYSEQLRPLDKIGSTSSVTNIGVYDSSGHAYSVPSDYTATVDLSAMGTHLSVQLQLHVHPAADFRMDPPLAAVVRGPILLYPLLDVIPPDWTSTVFAWTFKSKDGSYASSFVDTPARQGDFRRLLQQIDPRGVNYTNPAILSALTEFGVQPGTFALWKDNFPRRILVHTFPAPGVYEVDLKIIFTKISGAKVTSSAVRHEIRIAAAPDSRCLPLSDITNLIPTVSFLPVRDHTTCDLQAAFETVALGPRRAPDYQSVDFSGKYLAFDGGITVTVSRSGEVFASEHFGLGAGLPGLSASFVLGYVGLPDGPPPDPAKVDAFLDGWTWTAGIATGPLEGPVGVAATIVLGTTDSGVNGVEYGIVASTSPAATGQASCAVDLGSLTDSYLPLQWLSVLQPTSTWPLPAGYPANTTPTPSPQQARDITTRIRTAKNDSLYKKCLKPKLPS